MILKKSYKSMYGQEAKRNLFLTIINTICIFLALPFYMLQKIVTFASNYGIEFKYASHDMLQKRNLELDRLTYENAFLILIVMMIAILNGIILFYYLTSKPKQDFYFALPIKRKALFWVNYIQGIINVIIPLVFNGILVLILAGTNNCLSWKFAGMLAETVVLCILFYLAVFSICVLSFVLCGKMIMSLVSLTFFVSYGVYAFQIFNYYFEGRLQSTRNLASGLYMLSPLGILLNQSSYERDILIARRDMHILLGNSSIMEVMALILIFAVSLTFARVLFVNRNTGDTGKAIVFPAFKKMLKLFMVVLLSIGISVVGQSFYDISSLNASITGLIIGLLFSIIMIDMIFEWNWKAAIKNWRKQWVYILITAAAFAGLIAYAKKYSYDGFKHIPYENNEKEALKAGCVVASIDVDYDKFDYEHNITQYIQVAKKIEGIETLDEFIEKVDKKQPCKLRILRMEENWKTYIDYVYDGKKIKVYDRDQPFSDGTRFTNMVKITGALDERNIEATYYVLTYDKNETLEELKRSVIGWEQDDEDKDSCVLCILKEGGNANE